MTVSPQSGAEAAAGDGLAAGAGAAGGIGGAPASAPRPFGGAVTVCAAPGCGRRGGPLRERCEACGALVDLHHPLPAARGEALRRLFDGRAGGGAGAGRALAGALTSGVWRFHEVVAPGVPLASAVSLGEGRTPLYESAALGRFAGLARPLLVKHEGMNPTGSFKDRGMTVGATVARALGRRAVACASTGNTAASLAAYAAACGLRALVLIPEGKIAYGKLAQSIAYGARVLQVEGGFDEALALVESLCARLGVYLLNSVNPWRIEGQKAIGLECLQDLGWSPPDWIALPAGNLGNLSALGKALREARAAGLIDRAPRLLAVQAEGASPFARMVREGAAALVPERAPETVATAIRIGDPRSWMKAARALAETAGTAEAVSDDEILEAKAAVDAAGIGCEPASAASVAGIRRLVARGAIDRGAEVVAILTGHVLKDPDTVTAYHRGEIGAATAGGRNPVERVAAHDLAARVEAILAEGA